MTTPSMYSLNLTASRIYEMTDLTFTVNCREIDKNGDKFEVLCFFLLFMY